MICKFCNTENPDDAVFCKDCGRRLDGMIICPSCGKEMSDDTKFCIYCGKKFVKDEPIRVQPQPVKKVYVNSAAGPTTAAAVKTSNFNWKRIVNIIAVSLSILLAVIAFGFMFGIGVSGKATATTVSVKTNVSNIYYYFGKAYSDIDKALEAMDEYSGAYATAQYLPVVFGTVFSALTMIAVITFTAIALVNGIRYLLGKSEKTGGIYSVSAFMSFLVGAILLLFLKNTSIVGDVVKTSFNGATVAGIILGAIALAGYTGCAFAVRGRELLNVKTILKCAFSAGAAILAMVVLIVLSKPTYGMADDSGYGNTTMVNLSVVLLINMLGEMAVTKRKYFAIKNYDAALALTIVTTVLVIATIVIAAWLLISSIKKLTGESDGSGFVPHAVLFGCALVLLVFSIVTAQQILQASEYVETGASEDVRFTYAVPIVTLVMAVLALAAGITNYVLQKTLTPREEYYEEVYEPEYEEPAGETVSETAAEE